MLRVLVMELDESEFPLLITTVPVASYTWSAGVKNEITPRSLFGVLTDTVLSRFRALATGLTGLAVVVEGASYVGNSTLPVAS